MGSFLNEAKSKLSETQLTFDEMEIAYSNVAEYFVFDRKAYPLNEFMSNIKEFKDQFKVITYHL